MVHACMIFFPNILIYDHILQPFVQFNDIIQMFIGKKTKCYFLIEKKMSLRKTHYKCRLGEKRFSVSVKVNKNV